MVIAGLFWAGIFLGWNTMNQAEASAVYVDPLTVVAVTVPVGTNKAIDKNAAPHYSGSDHETKV